MGALRRPAQSLVGASKTTSTSPRPTASRSISVRSAESTSPITRFSLPSRRTMRQRGASRRGGTLHCPSGQLPPSEPRRRRRAEMTRTLRYESKGSVAATRSYAGRVADPVIRLDSDRVSVEPGGQAQVGVTILNPGSIVEGYRLDVVGEGPSSWAEVTPAEISVYPQAEAKAFVTFHPPGGNAAPGGTSPFGVRVRSTVDADASAVAEGDVEIGKVFGLQAKIVPVTSSGRWRGRHTLQLSNWGNAPAKLRVVASDPDEALGFYVRPDVVELPLGGTGIARVSVRTRKPFLRGNRVTAALPNVAERADTGPTPRLQCRTPTRPGRWSMGRSNQKPILSRAVVALLGLVLVAGLGLGAYAMFFLKSPTDPAWAELAHRPNRCCLSRPRGRTRSWCRGSRSTGSKPIGCSASTRRARRPWDQDDIQPRPERQAGRENCSR